MGLIETLLAIAERLFGLRGCLATARQNRKSLVAEYLSEIALVIENTCAKLRQGQYPHDHCTQLRQHSLRLSDAIGDLIGQAEADQLVTQLQEVWEIEQLYHELSNQAEPNRNRSLNCLDQAAGLFRATAAFVRVSP